MKTLLETIFESTSLTDQINMCKSIIDRMENDAHPPREVVKVFQKMYLATDAGSKELVKNWLLSKGMSKDQIRCVQALVADYDLEVEFSDLASNDGMIDAGKLLDRHKGSLQNTFQEALKFFPQEFIDELMHTQPGQKGVTVGPGEIALMILMKSCTQNTKTKKEKPDNTDEAEEIGSDLKLANHYLEIKGKEARFLGQGVPVDYKSVISKAKEKYGITISNARKNMGELAKFISNDPSQLSDFVRDCFDEYLPSNKFFEPYIGWLALGKCKSIDDFGKSLALYALQVYQEKEKFTDIILINTGVSGYPFLSIYFKHPGSLNIASLWKYAEDLKLDTFIDPNGNRREIPKVTYIGQ